jgi:putative flippase GtrA
VDGKAVSCPAFPEIDFSGFANDMNLFQKISGILPSWVRLGTSGTGDSTRISCTVEVSQALATFCVIGVVNSAIHFGVLTGLVEGGTRFWALDAVAQDEWKPWFNGLAFLVANFFSYFANSHWSFKAETGVWRYLKFAAMSSVGFVLSIVIMHLGVKVLHWHYWLVFAAQVAIMPFVNFSLLRLLVFRHRGDGAEGSKDEN